MASTMGNEREPHLIAVGHGEEPAGEPGAGVLVYSLPEGITLIGRSKRNDICLRDSSVSRFHCYLERHGPEVRIYDSMSRNRTQVGSEPARGQALRDGDTLCLGRCRFIFRAARAVAALEARVQRGPPEIPLPAAAAIPEEQAASGWAAGLEVRGPARRGAWRRRPGPRARPAALSPYLLPILVLLAGLGGVAGVVLGRRLLRREEAPAPPSITAVDPVPAPAAPPARRPEGETQSQEARYVALQKDLEEAQDRIDSLQRSLDGAGRRQEAADGRRVETLLVELEKLRAEHDRSLKERDDLAVELRRKGKLEEGRRGEGAGDSRRQRTEVAAVPQSPGRPRSAAEVQALVERLIKVIDDYASPTSSPALLEPHLKQLARTAGKAGAEGVLQVYDHAAGLFAHVEKSIAMNQRLRDGLLAEAERLRPKLPADDPRGYGPRLGPAVEEKQRELELREKAVKIGGDQRRRLLALRDAVLAALAGVGRVADGEGTRALAARLGGEADGSLTLAIFEALAAARARHAVPVLIRRLESSKDPAVRGAARKTLTAIAGADLGEGREAWERWWEENKGG